MCRMAEEDLRTFIRDITRRHERIFQEQLKQWQKLHERTDVLNREMKEVAAEIHAQRQGTFKLIDAIRDLEEGFGGSSPA